MCCHIQITGRVVLAARHFCLNSLSPADQTIRQIILSADICESMRAAFKMICQFFVIDPQQPQHGCMQIEQTCEQIYM